MPDTKLNILVVDDEALIAESIKDELIMLGYPSIYTALNPEDGIATAHRINPNLAFVDINFHGKQDGLKLAQYLKDNFDIPVIFLTGYTDKNTILKVKMMEPGGYIVKPFTNEELYTSIEIALYKHRAAKEKERISTQLAEAYSKLQESEETARALLNTPTDAVLLLDTKGTILDVNDFAVKMLNSTREHVLSKNLFDLIPPETAKNRRKEFSGVVKSGKPSRSEDESAGTWFDNSIYPILDNSGKVSRIAVFSHDITERITATRRLTGAINDLNQILGTTTIGLLMKDENGFITRSNDAFLQMFGLSSVEIIGKHCREVIDISQCNTDVCSLNRLNQGEKRIEFECEKTVNNKAKLFAVTAVPLTSANGEITGSLNSFTDITEFRKLQEEKIDIIEVERQRISRDLHDGIGQKLTAISLMVGSIKSKITDNALPDIGIIDNILTMIKEITIESQEISRGIRTIRLKGGDLYDSLNEIISSFSSTLGVSCEMQKDSGIKITNIQTIMHLTYIVQEAVNNSVKHGHSKDVIIHTYEDEENFFLDIIDNGIGMASSPKERSDYSGMGFKTMKQRTKIIGAEIDWHNREEGGFIVAIELKKIYCN